MEFKKEWTWEEHKAVIKCFSRWEKSHLIITYGDRERTTEDTYGLPYTSSSSFAMLSNTNVCAELISPILNEKWNLISPILNEKWNFDWLALTEKNEVVAGFTDADENEKQIVIGTI